jgi:hypothetical protein
MNMNPERSEGSKFPSEYGSLTTFDGIDFN